jgi:hypothetical protein
MIFVKLLTVAEQLYSHNWLFENQFSLIATLLRICNTIPYSISLISC